MPQLPFTPNHVEFLAEDEEITVIPNFKLQKLDFINGSYGPFQPSVPATVPIWLAAMLKKQKKCHIQPPTWLSVENFRSKLKDDREVFTNNLGELPYYYMVTTKLLLECAEDDIPQSAEVHSLLSSLWEVRSEKLRKSMLLVDSYPKTVISCGNMSSLEINTIKPLLCKSLDKLYDLRSDRSTEPTISSGMDTTTATEPKRRTLRSKK